MEHIQCILVHPSPTYDGIVSMLITILYCLHDLIETYIQQQQYYKHVLINLDSKSKYFLGMK